MCPPIFVVVVVVIVVVDGGFGCFCLKIGIEYRVLYSITAVGTQPLYYVGTTTTRYCVSVFI